MGEPRIYCQGEEFIPLVTSVAVDVGVRAAIILAITCHHCQTQKEVFKDIITQEAQNVGISKATVNRLLRKLCEAGYLTRRMAILPTDLHSTKDNGICGYCNEEFPSLDGHHIIPQSKDGPDVPENKTYLCPNHHRLAHTLVYHTDLQIYQDGREWRIS